MIPRFQQLDRAFENRFRLCIMLLLASHHSMDFSSLKSHLHLTDGNLASHLKYLERLGYIGVRKTFIGRKPNTRYSTTKIGMRAFRKHLKALKLLIDELS